VKKVMALCCIVLFVSLCSAQTATQLDECQQVVTKDTDPVIAPSICAIAASQLSSKEHFLKITGNGEILAESDGVQRVYHLSGSLMSTFLLQGQTDLIKRFARVASQDPNGKQWLDGLLPESIDHWEALRDRYCEFHPGDSYRDFHDDERVCQGTAHREVEPVKPITSVVIENRQPILAPSDKRGTETCQKAITFAIAESGGLGYQLPKVSAKWLDKVQQKYPNVCFLQYGARSGQANYLIVMSSTNSAYSGLQPIFHRGTTTTPVSGSGTVTDNAGGMWAFTYQGTVTTTTTTQSNLPYTDTTESFYANAYTEDGSLVGTSERSTSSRQGGDPSNALGYNLMARLMSIHLKEHLLDNIIKRVSTLP
jgi:hypothetical protein